MVTTRQIVNAYTKAVRQAEKERKRQAREAARVYKQHQKELELLEAREAFETYNDYVNAIISVHHLAGQKIDWNQITNEPMPIKPLFDNDKSKSAKKILDQFKPSLLDKIFGYRNKVNKLEKSIMLAERKEQSDYEERVKVFENDLDEWNLLQRISEGIAKREPESYLDAIKFFKPFTDLSEIGNHLEFEVFPNYLEGFLHVNEKSIVPEYTVNLTSTGKLSKRSMTKTQFNELYQDHVCSAALRVATETFSILPVEYVAVHTVSNLLNTKTGHLEEQAILSVAFTRKTLDSLNLTQIDPSDSMSNFVHEMSFSKTKGFKAISKVKIEQFIS